MQQQLQELAKTVDARLGETNKAMQEGTRLQFRDSKELMQEISREMNELRNVVKGVTEVESSRYFRSLISYENCRIF